MVGTVIGSGIFLVPRTMIQRVGTPQMVFVVWVVGGLLSLAGALSYAELAAALPEAGGEYAFLREAYGPMWGFLYSWTQMWVAKSGSIATLATGFFVYLSNFFAPLDTVFYSLPLPLGPHGGPLEMRYGQLFAIALILLLGWLNYYGVKLGGNVQVAVTVVKVALIAVIIVSGLALGHAHAPPPAAGPRGHPPLTFAGFIAALVAALWAYDGWNNVSMVSSEVRDPQRNLPLALIGGTLAVIGIYLLANAAYFHVLTATEVAGADRAAGRNDAQDLRRAGRQCGFHRRHDQHFRRPERFHSVRLAGPLRGRPAGIFLLRHRPRQSEIPHAGRFDSGVERMGVVAGAFRKVR